MSGVFEQLNDALRDVEALHLDTWYDNGCHFTCDEFEAIYRLLIALGLNDQAEAFRDGHADTDSESEGDRHCWAPEPMAGELLAVTP